MSAPGEAAGGWLPVALRLVLPLVAGAAASLLGHIPLMGLPGMVVAELTGKVLGFSDRLTAMGPGVWGLGIYVTWCAGAGIPLGCWLLWALVRGPRWSGWLAAGLVGYVLVGALSTLLALPPPKL